jgi:type IV secretory pathway VirB10-like protein
VRKEFSKVASSWFHKYLQARAKEQFDLDHTFFTSKAFIESVGKGTLHRFMTCHLLEIFSEKLTRTLQRGESRCLDKGKSDAVPDEVEASEETSLEFPNVSCEEVDDVISLENSIRDETPPTLPEPETVPPPEPEPPGEPKPEPVPETSPVKEEVEAKHKKEEEVERKKEEEVEREKKEEEEDAAAAAATSASADLSWAEPPAANDGWASFMATTSAGKKKKGKKGKVRHLGYVMAYSRALTLA